MNTTAHKKIKNASGGFTRQKLGSEFSGGFTLVETVVAILILSLSVGALLTLSAGGFFSVRYARNQIVADNLAQESLEYIRNTRDNAFLQSVPWATWLSTLDACSGAGGCWVDAHDVSTHITACNGTCPVTVFYPDAGFYGYSGGRYQFSVGTDTINTSYIRKVTTALDATGDQLTVTATISWQNGTSTKTVAQSMILTNWNK